MECFEEKSDTTIKWHELACNLRGKPLVNHEISYQHCAIAVFVGDQTRKTVQRHFSPYATFRLKSRMRIWTCFVLFLQALEPNSSDGSSHFFRDITSSHKRLALITPLLHPKVVWGREETRDNQTSSDSYFSYASGQA